MLPPENRSDLKPFGIIAVKALKNIDGEEELYVIYGSKYTFSNARSNAESQ